MRILIVQLLRLGDVIASAPVIEGLRRQYPKAEIDLLINEQCLSLVPLLPQVEKFWTFPRSAVQSGLGQANSPFFHSYDLVEKLVEDLNGRGYALLVNLTHNRLSARLCDLIVAGEKRGLVLTPREPARFGSKWFEHLNAQEDLPRIRYHFTDIFRFGAGLIDAYPAYGMKETPDGMAEATRLLEGVSDFVALQPLTSDTKKNWGFERFSELLRRMKEDLPSCVPVVLAAPNEELLLREWLETSGLAATEVRLAVCSLETAYSVLCRARLLITLDTSIKHLAAAAGTPLIELVLGSSDEQATGAYCSDALILRSQEFCAPCRHSQDCHRTEHFCAGRIEPEEVAAAASLYLVADWDGLKKWALRQKNLRAMRTRFSARGVWSAEDLAACPEKNAGLAMERIGWKLHLDFVDGRESSPGSECLVLADEMRNRTGAERGLYELARYIESLAIVRAKIDELDAGFRTFFLGGQGESEFRSFQKEVKNAIDRLPENFSSYRMQLTRCLADRPTFIDLKRIRISLASAKEKCRSDRKMAEQTRENLEGVK